jgi:gas vesicle protein
MARYEYEADEPFVVIEQQRGSASSFLWGMLIGAGVALLFAPQTGLETRQRIGRRARRVSDSARRTAEELSDTVVDRYEHARRSVEDRIDAARRAIDLKKRQASRAIEAGRQAAQEARDELERRIAETKAAYQAGANVARGGRVVPASAADADLDEDLDGTGGA